MKKTEYAYFIEKQNLSIRFTELKELFKDAIMTNDIGTEEWEVYKDERGEFIYLDVAQVADFEDKIDAEHFIELLMNDAIKELGNSVDGWYLEDVDIPKFEIAINKFWKEYKEKARIQKIAYEVEGTKTRYKVYIKQVEKDCYNFVGYEEVLQNDNKR